MSNDAGRSGRALEVISVSPVDRTLTVSIEGRQDDTRNLFMATAIGGDISKSVEADLHSWGW